MAECRVIEIAGGDVEGNAVHIASRASALATAGEIPVSRTEMDMVEGSGLRFEEHGGYSLKGLLEPMDLYAASHWLHFSQFAKIAKITFRT
jgi:class 3 adenylate cyclase